MINNRQKSSVAALKWSNNGTKIAIAYEDGLNLRRFLKPSMFLGQVIVGSVDGNSKLNIFYE